MSSTIPRDALLVEKVNRKMQDLAKRAPRSIAAHAALFHRTDVGKPVLPAAHHLEWIRIMEDAQRYRWVVVIAPPGYAKSSWFSIFYPTWRIGATHGRIRIGLVSNTASLTYGFTRSIQRTIADPKFNQVYGVEPDQARGWSQKQFWVSGSADTANPTLLASGIGGPLQGKRFDEIILDDPTTWEEARSESTMEAQRHWLKALLLKRFPPGMGPPHGKGRMVVVLTRWGERDLVMTFREMGFHIITMPALGYWDREVNEKGDVTGWGEEPLWPERETKAELLKEREDDPIIFELVKQGNPRVMGGDVFDPAWFQSGLRPERSKFEHVVQYVDTAGGKDRKRGDFFAMATVGVLNEGKEIWILGMRRGRMAAPEQEAAVIEECDFWNPDICAIEDTNEGTALYQRLVVHARMPLKPIRPVKDKEFRAIPLANAYRELRVFHPLQERWVRSFEAELAAFPRGAHDDQVDAAAGAFNESGVASAAIRILTAPSSGRGGRRRRW